MSLNPISTNNMNGTNSSSRSDTQAVFSLAFHPTEPILFLGLILRLNSNVNLKQIVTICALSLLEPSMRILGLQNIEVPTLSTNTTKLINIINDSHASKIICENTGGYILIKFTHSTSNEIDNKRIISRSCSILVLTLNRLWRIANGCASSLTLINQVSIPIDEYMNILQNDKSNSDKKLSKKIGLDNFSSVQSIVRTNNRTDHIVIAIRPVGDITNTGSTLVRMYVYICIYICVCICDKSYFGSNQASRRCISNTALRMPVSRSYGYAFVETFL
jgi:hypothetical protein